MSALWGVACTLVALVATATASDHMTYNGRFTGTCGGDGLYYKNSNEFVICSNGEATDQKCAPGSANEGYGFYNYGQPYNENSFCSVNLVGYGYGHHHYAPAPYATYNRNFYGQNYYGYPPFGYYPYAFRFPYYGYPFAYPGYGNLYGRQVEEPRAEAASDH